MTDKERKIIDKRLYGNLSKLGRIESKEASMKFFARNLQLIHSKTMNTLLICYEW